MWFEKKKEYYMIMLDSSLHFLKPTITRHVNSHTILILIIPLFLFYSERQSIVLILNEKTWNVSISIRPIELIFTFCL